MYGKLSGMLRVETASLTSKLTNFKPNHLSLVAISTFAATSYLNSVAELRGEMEKDKNR